MPVLRSEKYREILRRRTERIRPDKIVKTLSLKDFYEKRNKILMIRSVGGLGDIIMHRMIFEDIKLLMPEAEVHFACPRQYHDAVKDHPLIDKLISIEDIDKSKYILSYNTTTACGRTEMRLAPHSGYHRSDIWANHCGIELTRHNMHFVLTNEEKEEGKRIIENVRDREGPSVLVCPTSAMVNKNLLDRQLLELTEGIRDRGLYPFGLHNHPLLILAKNDMPYISNINIRQWLSVIHQADYVVSVDTATFHAAGGMKKPLVGTFTFTNAETYGKYYPTVELVQGHCPAGYSGCYNWGVCPYIEDGPVVPCCSNISSESILKAFDKILVKEMAQERL
ncbi:glycosyltransferase family 9 protein [Patescibacteria group bacterium]|nr:glycosyltransferase family 9 protein [Patescibacteria group bacterium]